MDVRGHVGFAFGTGRCGTHLIHTLLKEDPDVAVSHERGQLNEAFERYCQWYELPVDHEGFLAIKDGEIRDDLSRSPFSFECSAFLCFSARELYERFHAKFIFLVRNPLDVVNSYWSKGWYREPYVQADPDLALGFQVQDLGHHVFSRIAPRGDAFHDWNRLTIIGKNAWFWNVCNGEILRRLAAVPEEQWMLLKLEELNYATYGKMTEFLGIETVLSERRFRKISGSRPGSRPNRITLTDWSESEAEEFEREVEPVATQLGYEFRVDRLKKLEQSRPSGEGEDRTGLSKRVFRFLRSQ